MGSGVILGVLVGNMHSEDACSEGDILPERSLQRHQQVYCVALANSMSCVAHDHSNLSISIETKPWQTEDLIAFSLHMLLARIRFLLTARLNQS